MIARLPRGYDTILADFGVELSRGEKQRITLARALLKDAPILIFDEATASIDRESSHTIMQTISESMPEKTIVMVTHEAYLLDGVDRVICIRDGRVCFQGSPSEYLKREFGNSSGPFDEPDRVRETTINDESSESPKPDDMSNKAVSTDSITEYIQTRNDSRSDTGTTWTQREED